MRNLTCLLLDFRRLAPCFLLLTSCLWSANSCLLSLASCLWSANPYLLLLASGFWRLHTFPQTLQNFVQCPIELLHRRGVRFRCRQENEVAPGKSRVFAARMQAEPFAQSPLGAVAVMRLALLFRHHERRAHKIGIVAPPMRPRLHERVPNDLRLIERAVKLRRCQAIAAGKHGGSLQQRKHLVGAGHVPALNRFGEQNARSVLRRLPLFVDDVGTRLAASLSAMLRVRTQQAASLQVDKKIILWA